MSGRTVVDGSWVVLQLSGGERKLQRVRTGGTLRVGKYSAPFDPLVGAPYGANFVMETLGNKSQLVRDGRTLEQIDSAVAIAAAALGGASESADNSMLRDEGAVSTAQELNHNTIERLKSEGTSGEALVLAIAAGSKTFAGKTAFSQEKYLRKKARKHILHITVVKPSPLNLVDLFMVKAPEKLFGLRRDTLGMILSFSNAQPGSRALVLDGTSSILSGTIAQRMGGVGRLVMVHIRQSSTDGLQWLNVGENMLKPMGSVSLAQILQWEASQSATTTVSQEAMQARIASPSSDVLGENGGALAETGLSMGDGASASANKAVMLDTSSEDTRRSRVIKLTDAMLDEWLSPGFTSLAIAVRESPAPILTSLLKLLRPGSPFVIYSQAIEPLAQCSHLCHKLKVAVRLQLLESFTRAYQVATNRTHPNMNTYPATGYVLSGVKVVPDSSQLSVLRDETPTEEE